MSYPFRDKVTENKAGELGPELVKESNRLKLNSEEMRLESNMRAWQRVARDTRPGWEDLWLVSHLHDQHGWEVSRQLETREEMFSAAHHRNHQPLF